MDWYLIGPMLGGCAAFFTMVGVFGKVMWERANSEGRERERASDAELQSAAAVGQIKMLASEFGDYRERMAHLHGSYEARIDALVRGQDDTNRRVTVSEDRNTEALKELRQEVRDLRNDVARLVEKLATRGT